MPWISVSNNLGNTGDAVRRSLGAATWHGCHQRRGWGSVFSWIQEFRDPPMKIWRTHLLCIFDHFWLMGWDLGTYIWIHLDSRRVYIDMFRSPKWRVHQPHSTPTDQVVAHFHPILVKFLCTCIIYVFVSTILWFAPSPFCLTTDRRGQDIALFLGYLRAKTLGGQLARTTRDFLQAARKSPDFLALKGFFIIQWLRFFLSNRLWRQLSSSA